VKKVGVSQWNESQTQLECVANKGKYTELNMMTPWNYCELASTDNMACCKDFLPAFQEDA